MGGARGALGLSPRLREPPSRRLRRLRIAHERMARRRRKRGETRAENRLEERADDTVVRVKGEKADVGVVTDAAPGRVLGLDVLAERDSDGFMEWLGDFTRGYGVEAMVRTSLAPISRWSGVRFA